MTILGVDTSHFQGAPNWSQVKQSGRDFCVLKATEGTTYVDPSFATNRKAAHAAGLIVGFYHFCRLGSPAAEAAFFARTVGPLQPGEFVVLDYEPNPVPAGSAAWSKQWLDAVRSALGVSPLIYMNRFTAGADNWSAVAVSYALWAAIYDNSLAQPSIGPWSVAMKQYSSSGIVPGIAGACDVDVFYGTTAQLLAFGKGGTPLPEVDLDANQAQQLADIHTAIMGGDPSFDNIARIAYMLKGSHDWKSPDDRLTDLWNAVNTIADAVVAKIGELPAVDAQTVAGLVIAQLGQRINTPPAA